MKNLHAILSNEPTKKGDIAVGITLKIWDGEGNAPQHSYNLYITSDEEIKEGDYFLYNEAEVRYKSNGLEYHGGHLCHISGNNRYAVQRSKKIILTTDEKLIADGVQSIPNDFLEWYVDNPKCEEVEIKMENYYASGALQPNLWQYKIVNPKEEPNYNMKLEVEWVSNNPQCKQIESCYNSLTKKCICPKEPKQETLEEAAEKYVENFAMSVQSARQIGFKDGAKWQQERMYSEKEVKHLIHLACHHSGVSVFKNFEKWFKQFKKK